MRFASRMAMIALMVTACSSLALAQTGQAGDKAKDADRPDNLAGHRFQVDDPMGRNSVTFTSEAPLEDIVGTSNSITGYIVFDPENPDLGGSGELVVPVASLNTGIPLRDEHLQGEAWLDAGNHPDIKFTITKVIKIQEVKRTAEFMTCDVVIAGEMSLHGQTKAIEVPGRFTYMKESDKTRQLMPGDLLAARASFEIKLADYGVTGPAGADIIGSKVGETLAVDVSFRASNAAGATAGKNSGR